MDTTGNCYQNRGGLTNKKIMNITQIDYDMYKKMAIMHG